MTLKATHEKGTVCDFCNSAIGDPGSNLSTIYTVNHFYDPGRQIKLCRKDLDYYSELVRQERESIAQFVKEAGYNALSEREKIRYKTDSSLSN